MPNLKIIANVLGELLLLEAVLLCACLGVGLVYRESPWLSFGLPMALAIVIGLTFRYVGRDAPATMGRRDSYLIVSLTWLLFSLVGLFPFLFDGGTQRIAVAFFESMSGFTTTGATALDHIDALPHALLFWRSLMDWVGGVGIIFFTVAILPAMATGEQKMFAVESTGLKIKKLHPRFRTTTHWIGGLYVTLTACCCAAYYFCGMGLFDAVNHAFSTMATGGFSTHDDSIGFYHSPLLEWVVTFFMFLGGFNFTLMYLLLVKRKWRPLWNDGELKAYLGLLTGVTVLCWVTLMVADGRGFFDALRTAAFHVTSLTTTTGFTTEDFMLWPRLLWLPLAFVTAVGACAGSTTGGIKTVRLLTIWKVTHHEFRHLLHPRAIFPVRVNGMHVGNTVVRNIFVFFICYFALTFVGTMLMVLMGLPLLDSVSCCITALSNVGPGVGYAVGPVDSYAAYPDAALWLNAFLMLAGRLEIFAILLPFVPEFWRKQ